MFGFNKSVAAVITVLAGLGLANSNSASAAQTVPLTLTQQGRLLDSSNAPVDGVQLTFTFTLYTAATGGVGIWTEDQIITPDQGYFSARLGETTPFPATIFDGSRASLYLGIKIGSDTEMAPRQQLTSVPFAMLALSATSASGALEARIAALEAKIATAAVTTAWQSYPCAMFDTTATAPRPDIGTGACKYRRVGDSAELRASVHFPVTPPTNGILALRLPPALTIDQTKVQTDVYGNKQGAIGSGWLYGNTQNVVRTLSAYTYAGNVIMLTSGDGSWNIANNSPLPLLNADITLAATVPITGWGVSP